MPGPGDGRRRPAGDKHEGQTDKAQFLTTAHRGYLETMSPTACFLVKSLPVRLPEEMLIKKENLIKSAHCVSFNKLCGTGCLVGTQMSILLFLPGHGGSQNSSAALLISSDGRGRETRQGGRPCRASGRLFPETGSTEGPYLVCLCSYLFWPATKMSWLKASEFTGPQVTLGTERTPGWGLGR